MATATVPKNKIVGGSFLIEDRTTAEVFTPEDFTEEHRQIAQTTEEFARKEIVPMIERIEHKEFQVTRDLLKKAAELELPVLDTLDHRQDRKSTRLNSSHTVISYAVFCLK